MKMLWNQIVIQLYEYNKNTEIHTLKECILWCVLYFNITDILKNRATR